jgi:TP901 family phage tail tape measure protein
MADVNANIGVHIDTSAALTELKNLQRQLATFHQSIAKGSAASVVAQRNLQTNLLNSINATGQFTAQMGLVRTSTESFTHALEKNKLGMKDYFRYAGGATRTFGRLFKQEFDTIQKTAEDRVKKMQTQYIKMGRDANGAMKAMAITPNTLNMKDFGTQTAIAAQKQALFNQLVKQGSTNLLNFGKNTQWAGRQLMVGFTVPLAYLGTAAAKTFMELEKQAIRFKRVYGDMFTTTEDTTKALREIELLAQSFTKYGVAVTETMEMAADAAAMGKVGSELTAQVAQATRLAILGGVEQGQALETTTSLTNAFGIAAEDLASKIDFLNSVENQTVVSIEDLTIAIPKAGPVVKQLGGDVEDLAFFLTAMKEGGINASEGANALKSGLASLINPGKKSAAMLNDLGVNINQIVESNKGDIKKTVIGFAQALDTLAPLDRSRAIEQLFGKFQFARLSTLFQNITKDGTQAARVLDLAGASVEELAILSERELKAVEDSVGTNFKAAVENLKLTLAPIGKEFLKAVTPIIKVVGNLLEKFNGLSDGTKKFLVIATTLVGIVGPTLLMTFGLLANGTANIIKLFLALRSGFLKAGSNTKVLSDQLSYMTMEQLEAATVATSLNQAHTRLTQSFTAETAVVQALRKAYVDATLAAAAFARSNPGMMMSGPNGIKPGKNNLGTRPKGFADGTTGLPGPKGAGDIIPILAAPGEAIIPSAVAQDPKFKPIISAMVNGTLQGFIDGTDNVQPFANSPKFQSKVDLSGPSAQVLNTNPSQTNNLINGLPGIPQLSQEELATRNAAALAQIERNRQRRLKLEKEAEAARTAPLRKTNPQITHVGKGTLRPIDEILASDPNISKNTRNQLEAYKLILRSQGLPEATTAHHNLVFDFPEWMNKAMPSTDPTKGVPAQEFLDEWRSRGPEKWKPSNISPAEAQLMDDAFFKIIEKDIQDGNIKVVNDDYMDDLFKKRVAKDPAVGKSSGYLKALDRYTKVTSFNLGPGLSTDPKRAQEILEEAKAKGLIKDFNIVERTSTGESSKGKIKVGSSTVTLNDGTEVNMNRFGGGARLSIGRTKESKAEAIINARTANNSDAKLTEIDKDVKKGRFGKIKPTDFGKQLTPTTGHSFPVSGIGGVYEKSDGTKVFVKPMMDDVAALAEVRATQIARDVHGLEAPEQTIKTMLDPTDPKGKRKIIVLESAFDPRFAPENIRGTFTKDEYFKQLVAANLRGDKDLANGNLGGSVLADVGTAGVFERASGKRTLTGDIKSMAEQARINLLGVKGGAKKFFAESTLDVPKNMTADEYHAAMIKEIDTVLPKLEKTINGFDLTEEEKPVYRAMIERLKEARKVDWREFHKIHSSVLTSKGESLQDNKTGKITAIKAEKKPRNTKPSSGKVRDNVGTTVPKGKSVVKTPKPRRVGKTILPGFADAPDARTAPGIRIVDAEKQFRADQNSLRRQVEKLEKIKIVELKKEIKQQRKQSEIQAQVNKMQEKAGRQIKREEDVKRQEKIQEDKNKAMVRQQNRIMKLQGVGMAAGMASTAGYMTGNVAVGNALMGISVLATLGPMLANPMIAAAAGLTAVTASVVLLRRTFDKAQDETMKMTESLGAGDQAIQSLAVFAKQVTAGEIMDKRRAGALNPFAIKTGKTTFGESFVKGEAGKSMLSNVGQSIKESGSAEAQKQVLNQMTNAVAAGALTSQQARSIVANLGKELGDYSFAIGINAKLIEILGPNGENLANDPLQVRMKIVKDTREDLKKQSNILGNSAGGALTRNYSNIVTGGVGIAGGVAGAGIGAGIAGAATAGAAAGSVVPIAGTIIGAAVGAAAMAGISYLTQKGSQEKLAKASGATVVMQKMALETSQEMQDSLTIQYEKELAILKAKGETAKAAELTTKYEANRIALLSQQEGLVKDIQNTYKNSSNAIRGALETGINKQITKKYKGTVNEDIAPLASDMIKDSKLSKESQYTVKMQLVSGQMDPMQLVNLLESFGQDKQTLDRVMKIVTKFGGATAGSAASLMNAFKDSKGNPVKKVQTDFIAKVEAAKTPEEAQKILDFYAKAAQTGNVLNTALVVETLLKKKDTAIDDLMTQLDTIVALKGPIKVEVLTTVLNKKELELLNQDLDYFSTLSDEEKKIYLQTLVVTMSTVDKNDPAFQTWITGEGSKFKDLPSGDQLNEYILYNAERVTESGDMTVALPKKGATGDGAKRDTTYDDILTSLKRTRDATIDATKGASELMRVLGGKKDLKLFKGIDQQLSKLGANSDFIDFIGGLEKAVQNKLIKINKKGVVSLTELGKATKKAYDEKQLGAYSAKSAQVINEFQKQRTGFAALKSAGAGSAEALDMVADANFAVALSSAKTSAEVKKLIREFRNQQKAATKTLRTTNPIEYFNTQMDVAKEFYDVQEELSRRTYEPEIAAIEKLVEATNLEIDAKQRLLETSTEYGSRTIDSINEAIDQLNHSLDIGIDKQLQGLQDESSKLAEHQAIMDRTIDGINKKYDLQEEALNRISDLNQEISAQQKNQLGLASAITQGDIAGAAKAAQEMRAESAANAANRAKGLIDVARDAEIAKVLSPEGLTAKQIADRQYQIDRTTYALGVQRAEIEAKIEEMQTKIYNIEQLRKPIIAEITRLEDLNYNRLNNQIPLLQGKLDKELASIDAQRKKWEDANFQITLANTKADTYQKKLKAAEDLLTTVSGLWGGLTDKNLTVTIQKIESLISSGTSGYDPGNQGGNGTPGTTFDDPNAPKPQFVPTFTTGGAPAGYVDTKAPKPQFVPTITIGGAPAGYVDTKALKPTITIGGAPAGYRPGGLSSGGLVPKYFAAGGFARGTDTVPAMLTPGEFVVRKFAVDKFGLNNLKSINNGTFNPGNNVSSVNNNSNSVYNYGVTVNVSSSNASTDDITRAVMTQIRNIDNQRVRRQR